MDVFLTWEPNAAGHTASINRELALSYYKQLGALASEIGAPDPAEEGSVYLLASLLRLPDVVDPGKRDVITEENWPLVDAGFDRALDAIEAYRITEGKALYEDVTGRVQTLLALEDEVESYEAERISAARERILKAAEDLSVKLDSERLEQEMIFYLEKLDINEEKVRLRQHCRYFLDTIQTEPAPGKKLGFILQEMGREINTTGSKANHSGIQKAVVRMKDELEKIREQSMNIL